MHDGALPAASPGAWCAGSAATAARAFPGRTRAIRTASGSPKSCCSRRRWPRCWATTSASSQRFPTCGPGRRAAGRRAGLWSGLGYYSRARNLHPARSRWWTCMAASSRARRGPADAARHRPLDGRGDRVLLLRRARRHPGRQRQARADRVLAFGDDLAPARTSACCGTTRARCCPRELHEDMPRYTQGLMDLGATVCLPRNPSCLLCPCSPSAKAGARASPSLSGQDSEAQAQRESLWLLQAQAGDGSVWLQKRPTPGVWAGLYCLPVFAAARRWRRLARPARAAPARCAGLRARADAQGPAPASGAGGAAAEWPAGEGGWFSGGASGEGLGLARAGAQAAGRCEAG
jgi:hypothetical protein